MEKFNRVFKIIENIKPIIGKEDAEFLEIQFHNLISNSQQEEHKLKSNNFLVSFKKYKQTLSDKQQWRRINECRCSDYEICIVSEGEKLVQCKNFQYFIEKNSIFSVMFGKNIVIDLSAKINIQRNIQEAQNNVMNLLILVDNLEGHEKNLVLLSLFYFLYRNLYLLIIDKTLSVATITLLNLFSENLSFQHFIKEFNLDIDTFREMFLLTNT